MRISRSSLGFREGTLGISENPIALKIHGFREEDRLREEGFVYGT
jgi:hypothetical protein